MKEELRKVCRQLVSNFACEFTYSSLKNAFRVKSPITIAAWVSFIESAFLAFRLERFSFKLKEQAIAPKKIYCIDSGLAGAVSFKHSENFGRLMENTIAVELLRRKSMAFNGMELYYWKDHQQREVDFVVKKGNKVEELLQAINASDRQSIPAREIKALLEASKELKCKRLSIITWRHEGTTKTGKKTIKCIPLWKWLLEKP